MSVTCLEIFIFLVVPLYNSSRLHGNCLSIGGALREGCRDMELPTLSPSPPPNDAKISSPKTLDENLCPLPLEPPNGDENPKNSEKISFAFRGLNRNVVGPSPVEKKVAPPGPPAFGGGT